nr:hypothetical protein [Tanacetum cinerariifolium]
MTTLAEHIIFVGAENRPPLLEKSMYNSWVSRIRLFIKVEKYGRMMLDSIDEGLLVYPTVVGEDGQTRPKKYSKLNEAQQLQDDCDVQETNIILHSLPPDVYLLVNHQELYNLFDKFASVQVETLYGCYWRFSQLINYMHTIEMTMQQVQVNTKFLNAPPPEWSKFVIDAKGRAHGETMHLAKKAKKFCMVQGDVNTEDIDAYDSDCDDISSAKAVSMVNLSSYDLDVLSEVPYSDPYPNDMINQDVQEMMYSAQTHIVNFPDNEITSDSNINPYSQYLQESQDVEHQSDTKVFTMTMEILLEPTSNKLCVMTAMTFYGDGSYSDENVDGNGTLTCHFSYNGEDYVPAFNADGYFPADNGDVDGKLTWQLKNNGGVTTEVNGMLTWLLDSDGERIICK